MCVNDYVKKSLQVCSRLKKSREEAGYTSARSFALKYGLSPRVYQKHEAGKSEIRLSALIKYCKLLNKSYLWLIAGLDEYENKPFSDAEIESIDQNITSK